jgi:hypothetical protein
LIDPTGQGRACLGGMAREAYLRLADQGSGTILFSGG